MELSLRDVLESDDLLASVEPLDASRGGRSRGRVGNGGGSIDLPAPETFRESGRIGEIHLSLLPLGSCTPECVAWLGIGRRCCVDFAAGWGSILRRREPLIGWILEGAGSSMADEKMICRGDLMWLEDHVERFVYLAIY